MIATAKRFPWIPASAQPKARRHAHKAGGRPPKITDDQLVALVKSAKGEPGSVMCLRAMHEYGVSRAVFYTRVPTLIKEGRLARCTDGYGRTSYHLPKTKKSA